MLTGLAVTLSMFRPAFLVYRWKAYLSPMIIIFRMFNFIIEQSFHLMVSAGSLYWFHRHSRSPEILYGFPSCPPKWSIVIPFQTPLSGEGMENSHHFTISLYTRVLLCQLHYLNAALWFQTLFYWPQRTFTGLSLAA